MWADIQGGIVSFALTALGVLSLGLTALAPLIRDALSERIKLYTEQQKTERERAANERAQLIQRVSDQSVAAAEEIGRKQGLTGPAKAELAATIADEMTPSNVTVPTAALQASVQKMRASLPTSSVVVTSSNAPPGARIDVVMPPDPSVPPEWMQLAMGQTQPETPSSRKTP